MKEQARAIRAAFQSGVMLGGILGWLAGMAVGMLAMAHFVG